MTVRSPCLAAAPLILLAACAPQGSFPSLAPRAVERQYGGLPEPTGPCATKPAGGCDEGGKAAPAPPPADEAALRTNASDLLAAARQGQKEFTDLLPATNSAVARAGSIGSDAWIGAQQQLSRLEVARAKTFDALSALDALALARASLQTSAADLQAITDAAAEARRIADTQQVEIERLRAALNQP